MAVISDLLLLLGPALPPAQGPAGSASLRSSSGMGQLSQDSATIEICPKQLGRGEEKPSAPCAIVPTANYWAPLGLSDHLQALGEILTLSVLQSSLE